MSDDIHIAGGGLAMPGLGRPDDPAGAVSEEIHIAGIIVATARSHSESVRAALAILPGAIIHTAAEDGRMVVTLETTSAPATLDCMDAIRALPGVFNVALVYQHAEPAAAMEELLS